MWPLLTVFFCGATAVLFPLWQTEKQQRRSIQRAHNACVSRSMQYASALRIISSQAKTVTDSPRVHSQLHALHLVQETAQTALKS